MSRINLQRLDAAALRRYRRFYKLPDVGPNSTKEQLLAAINRHFTQQVSSLHLASLLIHHDAKACAGTKLANRAEHDLHRRIKFP